MAVFNSAHYLFIVYILCIVDELFANTKLSGTVSIVKERNNTMRLKCKDTITAVENSNIYISFESSKYINYVWARNMDHNESQSLIYTDRYHISTMIRAVDRYAGLLNFTFLTNKDTLPYATYNYQGNFYMNTFCAIYIHVDYKLEMQFVNSDKNIISLQSANGTYRFKEGDKLIVACYRPEYKSDVFPEGSSLRLYYCENEMDRYKNSPVCVSPESAEKNFLAIKLSLNMNENNSQCICEFTSDIRYKSRLLTTFVLVPDVAPTIIVKIWEYSDNFGTNVYQGMIGEKLEITCKNNEDGRGTLHWYYCENNTLGTSCFTNKINASSIRYPDFTLKQHMNGTRMKCVFTNPVGRETTTTVTFKFGPVYCNVNSESSSDKSGITSAEKTSIGCRSYDNYITPQLKALPVTPSSPIVVTTTDVSQQDFDESELSISVSKNFSDNEVIQFGCSIPKKVKASISMYFNESGTRYNIIGTTYEEGKFKTFNGSFKMNFSSDLVKVYCEAKKSGHVIGYNFEKIFRIQISTEAPLLRSTTLASFSDITDSLNGKREPVSFFIWIIIGIVTIIVICLFIVFIKVCKTRTVDTGMNHDHGTYENLYNEPVPPFPKSAKLEETYLKPSDCREYAVPIRVTDNVTYALPYVETNIENLYTKPVPKSLRKPSPLNATSTRSDKKSEPTYADIETYANKDNQFKKDTGPEYATIGGVMDGSNYTNVFNNQSYVNSKDKRKDNTQYDDYAEPSYCEIGKS